MDAFFAAVEVRERPQLAGLPVIVGGPRDSRRGVVATCSYEARRFGVRSAMPIRRAVELCPHGVFLPGRMALYREVSRRIFEMLHRFTPVVEAVSIDEAYLDLTADHPRFGSLEALGRAIKAAIASQERLTATVGIGPNKLLAKLATELSKPDGLRVVRPEEVDGLLVDLEVGQLPGVGPSSAARLRALGIRTVGDVRRYPRSHLAGELGRFGERVWELAWGVDPRPVLVSGEARSVSAETTFEQDVEEPGQLEAELARLAAEVGRRLRAGGHWARTVTLKARYADFVTVTRRRTLGEPTADDRELFATACQLLRRVAARPGGFRLLGIAAGSLTRFRQPVLWSQESDPRERAERVADAINERFGRTVVTRAGASAPQERPAGNVPHPARRQALQPGRVPPHARSSRFSPAGSRPASPTSAGDGEPVRGEAPG